ncbi:hypothetical protein CAPTEDRAFT_220881 [Capitella teleta]|uniref:HMG box domain-containing protein n=1 Tax=Capitella teleta TaxID=283909 RepID=R7V5U2_CAPTE|nr:hypothetical protein CAPTEDRAFT_220881 [Capitella teleta]|eukprot:ELU14218.1 hypothetical protein CAPTEDRAFT_220881 [Capitella teleta]
MSGFRRGAGNGCRTKWTALSCRAFNWAESSLIDHGLLFLHVTNEVAPRKIFVLGDNKSFSDAAILDLCAVLMSARWHLSNDVCFFFTEEGRSRRCRKKSSKLLAAEEASVFQQMIRLQKKVDRTKRLSKSGDDSLEEEEPPVVTAIRSPTEKKTSSAKSPRRRRSTKGSKELMKTEVDEPPVEAEVTEEKDEDEEVKRSAEEAHEDNEGEELLRKGPELFGDSEDLDSDRDSGLHLIDKEKSAEVEEIPRKKLKRDNRKSRELMDQEEDEKLEKIFKYIKESGFRAKGSPEKSEDEVVKPRSPLPDKHNTDSVNGEARNSETAAETAAAIAVETSAESAADAAAEFSESAEKPPVHKTRTKGSIKKALSNRMAHAVSRRLSVEIPHEENKGQDETEGRNIEVKHEGVNENMEVKDPLLEVTSLKKPRPRRRYESVDRADRIARPRKKSAKLLAAEESLEMIGHSHRKEVVKPPISSEGLLVEETVNDSKTNSDSDVPIMERKVAKSLKKSRKPEMGADIGSKDATTLKGNLRSAYHMYYREQSKKIRATEPDMSFGALSKFIGSKWHGLSMKEKRSYIPATTQLNFAIEKKEKERLRYLRNKRLRNKRFNKEVDVPQHLHEAYHKFVAAERHIANLEQPHLRDIQKTMYINKKWQKMTPEEQQACIPVFNSEDPHVPRKFQSAYFGYSFLQWFYTLSKDKNRETGFLNDLIARIWFQLLLPEQEIHGQTPEQCLYCATYHLNGRRYMQLCPQHLREKEEKDGIARIRPISGADCMSEDDDDEDEEEEDSDEEEFGQIECGHCDYRASNIALMTKHMADHTTPHSAKSEEKKINEERKEEVMRFPAEDYLQELTLQPCQPMRKQTARKTFPQRRTKVIRKPASLTPARDLSLHEILTSKPPRKAKVKRKPTPDLSVTPAAMEYEACYEAEIAPFLETSKCNLVQKCLDMKRSEIAPSPVVCADFLPDLESEKCSLVMTEVKVLSGLTPAPEECASLLATEIIPSLQPERELSSDATQTFSVTRVLHSTHCVCDLPCAPFNARHLVFFPTFSELFEHVLAAHQQYGCIYSCSNCTFSSTSCKVLLLHHNAIHRRSTLDMRVSHPLKCCVCPFTCNNVPKYDSHIEKQHSDLAARPPFDSASREIKSARQLLTLCCDLSAESAERSMPVLTRYNEEEEREETEEGGDPKLSSMRAVVSLEDVINVLLTGF